MLAASWLLAVAPSAPDIGSDMQVLGRMLVQYAKHVGIRTISIVRRSEQVDELKALG